MKVSGSMGHEVVLHVRCLIGERPPLRSTHTTSSAQQSLLWFLTIPTNNDRTLELSCVDHILIVVVFFICLGASAKCESSMFVSTGAKLSQNKHLL